MEKHILIKSQKQILDLVAEAYPQIYLVGGTALSLLYDHRISEDLDFFTQKYSSNLHREIAAFIQRKTGFKYRLIEEEKRKKYLPMAVYEFQAGRGIVLKADFVKDVAELFKPRNKNGIANIEDLFDVYYLSAHVKPLNQWFPGYFDLNAYERLTAWYLSIPKQKSVMELLDLVPDCDTKLVFKHLDDEIIHKLNREYAGI